jgi:tetratricopeptide (TPR) repeat protein
MKRINSRVVAMMALAIVPSVYAQDPTNPAAAVLKEHIMQRALFYALSILALALAFIPALAQEDPHAGHHAVGWVPRGLLERPVPLRDGIGSVREEVTTSSKQAEAFYHQGLAYLHSYVWIEAGRSFNQALRLDPGLAMAHVGLCRTFYNLGDETEARAALARAQALSANVSERERQRINIYAKQLEATAEIQNQVRQLEYKKAIDDALAADLNNAELWLLRGNAEESSVYGRGQRGGAASIAFYEAAMARQPDHFAAHHYLTHSYETIDHIDKALKHGEVYARLAPAIPHAQHMYGHDLRRVGRIGEAVLMFRKAYELEMAYYEAEKIARDYDWHHTHNLSLLATCYQYQGQMKTAESLFRDIASIRAITPKVEFDRREWAEFLLSRGRTQEALLVSSDLANGKWILGRVVGRILTGSALLTLNRPAEATSELAAAEKELSGGSISASESPYIDGLRPYLEGLRGEIWLRSGERAKGAALLKDLQKRLRAVPGPDAWIVGLFRLESIASMARDAGEWELAEYTAKQMLEHDSQYAGTHYALALVAEHKGDLAAARREFTAAERLWDKADPDLAELVKTRQKLASITQK